MVLGQVRTKEKSNEINGDPAAVGPAGIKGCIVTIDAMGCQKDISTKDQEEKKAVYVFAVKENQPKLWEDIRWFYQDLDLEKDVQAGFGRS
jgi:predicted transposase YbfD/YdcC